MIDQPDLRRSESGYVLQRQGEKAPLEALHVWPLDAAGWSLARVGGTTAEGALAAVIAQARDHQGNSRAIGMWVAPFINIDVTQLDSAALGRLFNCYLSARVDLRRAG